MRPIRILQPKDSDIPSRILDVNRIDRILWVTDKEFDAMDGNTLVTAGTIEVVESQDTESAAFAPLYISSTVAVSVPAISGTAVLPADSVVVSVASAFGDFQPAVGDEVRAIPLEALESDCLLIGAYVVGTDSIEVTFAAKEGGDGVTNANKNFKFLVRDLT